jgi:hypothetical protein
MPVSKSVAADQPKARKRLISITLRGMPSGFDLSNVKVPALSLSLNYF